MVKVQEVKLNDKVVIQDTFRHSRKSNFIRLSKWILSSIHIFFSLLFKYRGYEIFYISIPPMAYLSSLILPNKFTILVYDVYPDILELFGIKSSNPIFKAWAWANKRVFNKAHKIFTISQGMKSKLSQYVGSNKIEVVYNWTGVTDFRPIANHENVFIKNQNLEGKFVIQYSGNLSPTHNIEILIKIAEHFRNDDQVLLQIIGRGQLVEKLNETIQKLNLKNKIKLLDYQPDELLKHSLSAASLGVVLVGDKVANLSIPSKIYNIQACGVPILGIGPSDSEIDRHLTKYGNGKCFSNNDTDGIVAYINSLKNRPEEVSKLKHKSLLASQDFTSANANKYFEIYQDK